MIGHLVWLTYTHDESLEDLHGDSYGWISSSAVSSRQAGCRRRMISGLLGGDSTHCKTTPPSRETIQLLNGVFAHHGYQS